jgi:lantibiotic modifying enzyme
LIASDKSLDIVVGAAGAILCLLACQRTGAGSEILDIASMCGRHLLKMRRLDRSGNRTWPTLGGRHLTGMSHGAAGIAYALARLSQATGDREFLDAAAEGIRFESCEFVSTKKNWVDLREDKASAGTPDDPVCMVRWCHGAPGIGLARLGGLEGLDSPEIRNDIQAALQTTSRCGLLARDHICCGNMGLVETFLTAGLKLGDPLWTLRALRLTSSVVERARQTGSFRITFRNGFSNPSLFQGAAGVGYQMLRVAFPRLIPAVLLLE